jgi:hypothetical protein
MYLQKLDDGSYRVTGHPGWKNKDGIVNDAYLLSNGFYILIENRLTPISKEKQISNWVFDEEAKTVTVTYDEPTHSELLAYYRQIKLAEIEGAYNSYILSLYPLEKQNKYEMRYLKLLNKQVNDSLTAQEISEKAQLENLHGWYEGMLANHDADRNYILTENDTDKLKNYAARLENA